MFLQIYSDVFSKDDKWTFKFEIQPLGAETVYSFQSEELFASHELAESALELSVEGFLRRFKTAADNVSQLFNSKQQTEHLH